MCQIAGFANQMEDYLGKEEVHRSIARKMNQVQKHSESGEGAVVLYSQCVLACMETENGRKQSCLQPFTRRKGEWSVSISLDGELYNKKELVSELQRVGEKLEYKDDAEILLAGYQRFGIEYIKRVNGIFALSIWDERNKMLYLVRDRMGAKPLFYQRLGDTLVFSTEMKGLFAYPGCEPEIDRASLCEIFGLGPAKSYGKGVFKGVSEVLPGTYLQVGKRSQKDVKYWELESKIHEDSYEKTLEKTGELVYDAIKRQMCDDVPIAAFLSGGLDSSLVSAVCAKELKKKGELLDTFSFDFTNNTDYFKANTFQSSEDRPWVEQMVKALGSNHSYLECDTIQLIEYLYQAVEARDLPCMADIESSLHYFCAQTAKTNQVVLTGECADEIFGGYPWFTNKEAFETHAFPWSMSLEPRKCLLKEEVLEELQLESYVNQAYEQTIEETPILIGENPIEKRRREISYMNLKWFMVTLLDRMDRSSRYVGMTARVPFADYRIVEYLWNVPWEMKCPDGVEKGLLRKVGEAYLPKEIVRRKKSPYPKTYNPRYEAILAGKLQELLAESKEPICQLLDQKKVKQFLSSPSDYGKPWYGQLMAGPQMIAFLLQVNEWIKNTLPSPA